MPGDKVRKPTPLSRRDDDGGGSIWVLLHNGDPLNGTNNADFLLARGSNLLNGHGGDDIILGDGDFVMVQNVAGNNSFATAYDLDGNVDWWTRYENPLVGNSTDTPHLTAYVQAETGLLSQEYYRIVLTAGQTITLDIDGGGGALGGAGSVNTELLLYHSSNTSSPVASNNDSAITLGGYGSISTLDAFLTFVAVTSGTYYIRIREAASGPGGETDFEGEEEFLLNVSVTGHSFGILSAGLAHDLILGGDGDDHLFGAHGNDGLYGQGGTDLMHGGTGDDGFHVDSALDIVIEEAGQGNDEVFVTTSYVLPADQSIEILRTESSAETTPFINLYGNNLVNDIYGNAAANILDGGAGADTMRGRGGNDTMFVDDPGDVVVELANEGYDVVAAGVSWTLTAGAHVELITTGWIEGTAAINLTGNEFGQQFWGNNGVNILSGGDGYDELFGYGGDDDLRGEAGPDALFGGAGNDTLRGGLGIDTYFIDDLGDVVVELAGEGSDVLAVGFDYTLGAGVSVELMTTGWIGGPAHIALTGNELGNEIWGNDGVNVIHGGAGNVTDSLFGFGGNDVLNGGGGLDLLIGGAGQDSFAFTSPIDAADIIADFSVADDTILLDDAIFTGLSLGALSADAFVTGTAALDANDRIIYDAATGKLFFDADGSGAGAAVQFATLSGNPALSASDFTVI